MKASSWRVRVAVYIFEGTICTNCVVQWQNQCSTIRARVCHKNYFLVRELQRNLIEYITELIIITQKVSYSTVTHNFTSSPLWWKLLLFPYPFLGANKMCYPGQMRGVHLLVLLERTLNTQATILASECRHRFRGRFQHFYFIALLYRSQSEHYENRHP